MFEVDPNLQFADEIEAASAPAKQTLNGSRGVELYTAEDLEQVHA